MKFLFITLLLVFTQAAVAEKLIPLSKSSESFSTFKAPYNAIEADALRISLDDSLNGFVVGKTCDTCKQIKVIVTPQTKVFSDNVEVSLKSAKKRIGRDATVIYDVKTMQVTQIRW